MIVECGLPQSAYVLRTQSLARHSDIRLAMQVYTHVELADQTAAIAALPGPESAAVPTRAKAASA